jgi:hypothetical protein
LNAHLEILLLSSGGTAPFSGAESEDPQNDDFVKLAGSTCNDSKKLPYPTIAVRLDLSLARKAEISMLRKLQRDLPFVTYIDERSKVRPAQ